jgi:hypothetical protein
MAAKKLSLRQAKPAYANAYGLCVGRCHFGGELAFDAAHLSLSQMSRRLFSMLSQRIAIAILHFLDRSDRGKG